jgi:hypothetical protein
LLFTLGRGTHRTENLFAKEGGQIKSTLKPLFSLPNKSIAPDKTPDTAAAAPVT